jgi:butyryl-CoA dehydrogenase
MTYRAPVADIAFTLRRVAGLDQVLADGLFPDLDGGLLEAILEEAGRFATDVLAPLNRTGDLDPPKFRDGAVTTAPGWHAAYAKWIEGGWSSLTGDPAFGGQGLPMALQIAATDLWNQSNAAFAVNPLLSIGAIEALEAHGTEELRARTNRAGHVSAAGRHRIGGYNLQSCLFYFRLVRFASGYDPPHCCPVVACERTGAD